MEKLFALDPEVAGGWGPSTVVSNFAEINAGLASIPEVASLEYEFEGWEGDDLLATFPCLIVTERLAKILQTSGASGVAYEDVKISTSRTFNGLYPDVEFPHFLRLIPQGKVKLGERNQITDWSGHDLCVAEYEAEVVVEGMKSASRRYFLVVTEQCLNIVKPYISHCSVSLLS